MFTQAWFAFFIYTWLMLQGEAFWSVSGIAQGWQRHWVSACCRCSPNNGLSPVTPVLGGGGILQVVLGYSVNSKVNYL